MRPNTGICLCTVNDAVWNYQEYTRTHKYIHTHVMPGAMNRSRSYHYAGVRATMVFVNADEPQLIIISFGRTVCHGPVISDSLRSGCGTFAVPSGECFCEECGVRGRHGVVFKKGKCWSTKRNE